MASAALPTLKALQDCASWNQSVAPYIPQLYELPYRVLDNIGSFKGLQQVYIETNPLISGFAIALALAAVFFVVAEINKNYSQVDRAWSLLPTFYIYHLCLWARLTGTPDARVEFLASVATVWSARLTINYARKGGYNIGSEDYRWAIVKSKVPGWIWVLFNLTFIATIQSILLLAFSCGPAYVLLLTCQFDNSVAIFDWVYGGVMLGLVLVEFISDGQQWNYQEAKSKYRKEAKVPKECGYSQAQLDRGFITNGLWAYSRHPNFTAEQLVWFVLYQWSCFAAASMHSWAFAGVGSLILLFQGSTWLTEAITGGKYPDYKHYQDKVGMFMPASFVPYKPAEPKAPKIIRTSELAKRQAEKEAARKA